MPAAPLRYGPPIPGAPWNAGARGPAGVGKSIPARPTPNAITGLLIPTLAPGDLPSARLRHVIDRLTTFVNSLIRTGRFELTDINTWSLVLSSADVTDALGFVPGEDTSHNVVSITDASLSMVVTTESAHGLTGGEDITIVGSSNSYYNHAWTVSTITGPTTFVTVVTGGVGGSSTGGTWRLT